MGREPAMEKPNEAAEMKAQAEVLLATDKEGAIKLFLSAAEAGDASCYLSVAKIYQNDLKKPEEATPYYEKAAEAGLSKAYNPLAIAYKNGTGVPQDFDLAEEYAKKGVEAGDFILTYNYATWLMNGELGKTDKGTALELFRKAKECAGYAKAPEKVKEKIDANIAALESSPADAPAKKADDGKGWFLGFYGVMIVLGIAGCVLSAFAAYQLKQPAWYALYALFGTMIVGNVVPFAWKKLRYNTIHFYVDLGLAFLYIVAIVICAIVWYKAKGL